MHVRKCTHYVSCVLLYTFNDSCAGVYMYDVSLLQVCICSHIIFMHIYLCVYIYVCVYYIMYCLCRCVHDICLCVHV
jgi:hypothetical protein